MGKLINGAEYTTFRDLWNDPELLTEAEKGEIQLSIFKILKPLGYTLAIVPDNLSGQVAGRT